MHMAGIGGCNARDLRAHILLAALPFSCPRLQCAVLMANGQLFMECNGIDDGGIDLVWVHGTDFLPPGHNAELMAIDNFGLFVPCAR
mmetsp:Transcript_1846/g.3278  ORF Transcript_1846/g.3278 Transcript_1846/m.3278 type:complete len:87 (+) Transcript_1846:142-402(+)